MPRKKSADEATTAEFVAAETTPEVVAAEEVLGNDEEAEETGPTEFERVVVFFLDGQRYALPIERVQEIQQIVAFSAVPGGSAGIVGMVNLRGHVIPAVDMRAFVGLPTMEYSLETPMIICRVDDHLIALIVDSVQDVVLLAADSLQPPPAMHSLAGKMLGVARSDEGLIYVLDLGLLLGRGFSGWGS